PRGRAPGRVGEVDVHRVLVGRVVRVVDVDRAFGQREPAGRALGRAVELHLERLVGAHGASSQALRWRPKKSKIFAQPSLAASGRNAGRSTAKNACPAPG